MGIGLSAAKGGEVGSKFSKHAIRRLIIAGKSLSSSRHPQQRSDCDNQTALASWYASGLGTRLIASETRSIAPLLEKLFGYHLLFIGACKDAGMIESSPITHKIVLGNRSDAGDVGNNVGMFSDPRALALQNESIDVVVLHHALEFTASSRAVLREAVRVLRPGGHIVLITFQPLSLWGLKRLLCSAIPLRGAESREPPWEGRFRHPSRLIDWLGVLDVQELTSFSAMHEFPLQFLETGVRLKRLAETMENWGLKFKSPFGASNIIVGIKQSRPLTPSALKWRRPLPTPIHGVPSTLQGHSSQSGVSWKASLDADKINADRED